MNLYVDLFMKKSGENKHISNKTAFIVWKTCHGLLSTLSLLVVGVTAWQ